MSAVLQARLEHAPRGHPLIHLLLEEAVGAAPLALGASKRHIGIPQELVGLVLAFCRERDAEAGTDHDILPVDGERHCQRVQDARRERSRLNRLAATLLQNGELVAADAGQRILLAHAIAQALRRSFQA